VRVGISLLVGSISCSYAASVNLPISSYIFLSLSIDSVVLAEAMGSSVELEAGSGSGSLYEWRDGVVVIATVSSFLCFGRNPPSIDPFFPLEAVSFVQGRWIFQRQSVLFLRLRRVLPRTQFRSSFLRFVLIRCSLS